MITIINIIFGIATVIVLADIAQRHANGANYRELLKKQDKTIIERQCLRECEKFFKVTFAHKLCLKFSAIYFILVSAL
tara:strand:+ start:110 stop:343 length:234 start_codon:yes stop_codon:yes gene_type:complete